MGDDAILRSTFLGLSISVNASNQHSNNTRGRKAGQCAAYHGAQTQLGNVVPAGWDHGADAADLDGDRSEICESAQRVCCDCERARTQLVSYLYEIHIGDELIEHRLLAQDGRDFEHVLAADPHDPCKRAEYPPHDSLER